MLLYARPFHLFLRSTCTRQPKPSPSEGLFERILQNLEDGLRKSDPRDCSRIEQLAQTLEEAPLKLQKLEPGALLNGPIKLTAEASIDLQQFLSNQDQEASFLAYLLAARSNPKAAALRLKTSVVEAPLSWDGLWYLRTRALLTGARSPYTSAEQKLLRQRLPAPTFKRYHSPSYDPATTLSRLQRLSPSKGRLRQSLLAMARLALVQDNSQKPLPNWRRSSVRKHIRRWCLGHISPKEWPCGAVLLSRWAKGVSIRDSVWE